MLILAKNQRSYSLYWWHCCGGGELPWQTAKNIGDKNMDKILSTQGDSTLMFVIDTTDSMD